MGQKIAFGFGMLANQMFPAALGVFIIVLVQDLGFAALLWGIIQFLPRVFDAITDPIMGFISDNTRSKWGRRRQYVFIGAILMGIAYIAMWQLHKDDGVMYNFIYFLSWSLVFYLGLTIFSVPYVAMGYEISEDFHERTHIMAVCPVHRAVGLGHRAVVLGHPVRPRLGFQKGLTRACRDALAVWVAIAVHPFRPHPADVHQEQAHPGPDGISTPSAPAQVIRQRQGHFRSLPSRRSASSNSAKSPAPPSSSSTPSNVIAAYTFLIIVHLPLQQRSRQRRHLAGHARIGGRPGHHLPRHTPRGAACPSGIGKKRAFIISQADFDCRVHPVLVPVRALANPTCSSSPCPSTPSASAASSPS